MNTAIQCSDTQYTYSLTLGPVEDNGTDGYLKLIDGKWWFCSWCGTPAREVSHEEVATMEVKW